MNRTTSRHKVDLGPRLEVAVGGSDRPAGLYFSLIVTLLVVVAVIPSLLQRMSGGIRQRAVGASVDMPFSGTAVQLGAVSLFLAVASYCVGRRGKVAYKTVHAGGIAAILGLWAYMTINALLHGDILNPYAVIFPAAAVAVWVLRPSVNSGEIFGHIGFSVALLSVVLGLFEPEVGLYSDPTGQQAISEKGLVFDSQLVGPFGSTSNLGQFLALCLPFVLLLSNRAVRWVYLLAISSAVLWTGSRSSLLAIAAVCLVALVVAIWQPGRSSRWLGATVCTAVLLSVLLPFVVTDPVAFSGRANVWQVALRALGSSPVFGLGPGWFVQTAGLRTDFGPRSEFLLFHAHNQFFHILVTGGVIGLIGVMLVVGLAVKRSLALGRRGQVLLLYLLSFSISGSQELNLGIVDRFQFYGPALLPLLLILFSGTVADESEPLGERL